MVYRNLMTLTAALTLSAGIFFFNRGPMILDYLGDGILPAPPQRSLTVWSAIAFTRLFGAMLIAVGLIAWAVRKLDRPEDQRRVGLAFFIGSLSLSFIALLQQIAMWVTTTGWIIVSIVAIFPLSFGYMLFVRFGFADSEPLTLSQNQEGLRQQWVRQLSEAAAQQERNRLARDLHDSIKQQIFSISVSAAAAQERWTKDSAGARQALEDVRNSAREAMAEMEAMLHQLRPAPLENIGLVEALRKQAEALQYRTGAYITTEFSDLPDNDALMPGTQEAIFRIAQEALNNIARHARARNVHLRLYQQRDIENPVLWLKIKDDGSGFDTTRLAAGMGLANIKVRAAEIGGSIHIESAPGEGTNLVVSIPIISPDVNKIKRMIYAIQACNFAVFFITGILYQHRTGFFHFDLLLMPIIWLVVVSREEKGLLEKLRSMKNVPLKVSLGLIRYSHQTWFFAITFFLSLVGSRLLNQNLPWDQGLYFSTLFGILLIMTLSGFLLWGAMLPIHHIMKELKEKLSAIDFRQSTEQMRRQAIFTLMIMITLVVPLTWWNHELRQLLSIPLSASYLGYAAWWRYRS
jgi:signal transduction histidine kinase